MKFAVKALVMGLSANAVRISQKAESKYLYDNDYDYGLGVLDSYVPPVYSGLYSGSAYSVPEYVAPTTYTVPDYVPPVSYSAPSYVPPVSYTAPSYTASLYSPPIYSG